MQSLGLFFFFFFLLNMNCILSLIWQKAQGLQLENNGQNLSFSKPEGFGLVKQLLKQKYKSYKNDIELLLH